MRHSKRPRAPAHTLDLEYADVLVSLWRAGLAAEMRAAGPFVGITIPVERTDGFFLLTDLGRSLPASRDTLTGWQLTFYPPETDDPFGKLEHGADVFRTTDTSALALVEEATPIVWLIISHLLQTR